MTTRSDTDGPIRPKGKTTNPRRTTKTGPVETSVSLFVTELRTEGRLNAATETTAARAIAAAKALDAATAQENFYGCRQAGLALTEVMTELRALEPPPTDPIEGLLAQLTNAPTT